MWPDRTIHNVSSCQNVENKETVKNNRFIKNDIVHTLLFMQDWVQSSSKTHNRRRGGKQDKASAHRLQCIKL